MGFGKRLSEILKNRNMTVKELSDKSNIPATTLYSLIKRDSGGVNTENISKIATALNMPVYILLGWESNDEMNYVSNMFKDEVLSDRETTLIEKFRTVDEKGKHTIETVAEMEYIRCNKSHLTPMAAHNDYAEDEEEQRLIQEDLENL